MVPFEPTLTSGWNTRSSDKDQLEMNKMILFLCEGTTTEYCYFLGLSNNRKELGIKDHIETDVYEKTGKDKGVSHPKQLVSKAAELIEDRKKDESFMENDKIFVVFDTDCYDKEEDLSDLVNSINNDAIVIGSSYPSFEIFLFTHDDEHLDYALGADVKAQIESNSYIGNSRAVVKHFKKRFGFDPKRMINKQKLMDLSLKLKNAHTNACKLDQSPGGAINLLHSNISAKILKEIG